jgi:hypothetical protein
MLDPSVMGNVAISGVYVHAFLQVADYEIANPDL